MRIDKGYRFNLVIRDTTAENIRVGEFLERSGHKKSTLMVKALNEFLDRNPELENADGEGVEIRIQVKQTLSRQDIEDIVRDYLKENGDLLSPAPPNENSEHLSQKAQFDDAYVSTMVENLSDQFDF